MKALENPEFAEALNALLLQRSQIIHTRNAGSAVTRVVRRCDRAMEDQHLDLSKCQLMHVPDAVYHLLRNYHISSCSLSKNSMTKISPKLPVRFKELTELNVSNNKLSHLPDEMTHCTSLAKLDISHNVFVEAPHIVLRLRNLRVFNASNNLIADIDVSQLAEDSCIEEVDLRGNPLLPACHEMLSDITHVTIKLTERRREEWEDLDI